MHYCWQSVSDDGKNTLESINTALCGPQGARVKERERERERQGEKDCVCACGVFVCVCTWTYEVASK